MMRVGLVGCGSIGNVHATAIAGIHGAELCAFTDIRRQRAQAYSDMYTNGMASVYTSVDEMLNKEAVDAVHICTPHACHVPMAIAVLAKDIPVFLEKPPAISRVEFDLLKQKTEAGSGRLGICFQNRYNQAAKKVGELLAGGTLGKLRGGRAFVTWNRNASYYTESSWRGRQETEGGGVLINQAIHTLDLLLLWMGAPLSVNASMQNHHLKGTIDVEDTLEAYLTFSTGADPVRASFYATNAYVADEPVLIELSCESGFVRMEGGRIWYRDKNHQTPVFWQEDESRYPGKAYWGNGHEACISDFYHCLITGTPYQNDLLSVKTTFDTVMDIYDSARQGK